MLKKGKEKAKISSSKRLSGAQVLGEQINVITFSRIANFYQGLTEPLITSNIFYLK